LRWVHGDMQFAAVSDLGMIELRQFVDALRRTRPAGQVEAKPPQ
jgi:hypothetical protein